MSSNWESLENQKLNQATAAEIQVRPGGFWIRFVAAIIDSVIVGVGSLFLVIPIGVLIGVVGASDAAGSGLVVASLQLLSNLFGLVIAFFYAGYFYSQHGATPGKKILNLQLVHSETGVNPSFLVGGFRDTIGKLLSTIILMIGYLIAAFRSDKKALHDILFSTQVIRKS